MNFSEDCNYSIKLIEKLKSLDVESRLDFALINKAIFWAKKYHHGQFRKSGEAFYTHPLEVAHIIADYNLKTDVIVASILHDIVEDTDVTVEMILDDFGCRIAKMVNTLTRDQPDGSKLSVNQILNNSYQAKDQEILLIKLIDRLHNVQTIHAKSPKKMAKTIDETLNLFIIVSMYVGHKELEEMIYQLCCKTLSIEVPNTLSQLTGQDSHLDYLENTCTDQLVSQVFQNVIDQVKS